MNNFDASFIISTCIGIGIFAFILTIFILIIKNIFNKIKPNNFVNEHFETIKNQITSNNNTFTKVTTTKHVKKTIFKNGEKISEEETTTHNDISPITNCPNCGAKINNKSNPNCEYCNTRLY